MNSSSKLPFSSFFSSRIEVKRLLQIHAVIFLIMAAVYGLYHVHTAHGMMEADGNPVGRDFVEFWVAADFVKNHDTTSIYSPDVFVAKVYSVLGGHEDSVRNLTWRYPPPALFLVWPLSLFTQYNYALFSWLAFNLIVFGIATLWRSDVTGFWRPILFSAPAVLLNLDVSQTGILWAALFIAGFRLLKSQPILAGIFFGLLTIKPHFAILIPFVLLTLKHYKTLVAAALTGFVLCLASGLIFGWESWEAFLSSLLQMGQFQSKYQPFGATLSLYAMLQFLPLWLPLSKEVCIAIYVGCAAIITILLYRRLSNMQQAHWTEALLLVAPAVYLVSPYGLPYDLPLLSAAWILWLTYRKSDDLMTRNTLFWCLAWYAPFFWCIPFLNYFYAYGVHPTAILLMILFFIGLCMKQQKDLGSVTRA